MSPERLVRPKALVLACVLPWALACTGPPRETAFQVPEPDLSGSSEAVRSQLELAQEDLRSFLAEGDPSAAERGAAVGRLGRLYHAYDLTTDARTCYRYARAHDSRNPDWSYLLGFLEQVEGRLDAAADVLSESRGLEPRSWVTALRLADVLSDLGRGAEAEALYRSLVTKPPFAAAALRGLGELALEGGDPGSALDHLERALAAQPEALSTHHLLARAHQELDRPEEARRQLEAAAPVPVSFPDPRVRALDDLAVGAGVRMARGGVALAQGRTDLALEEYRAAVAEDPESVAARVNLASLLGLRGEVEEARRHLDRALGVDPRNVAARLALAEIDLAGGEEPAAVAADLDPILERRPDHAAALRLRARAFASAGEHESAVADLRRLVELEPSEITARLELGRLLEAAGDRRAAEEHYRVAAGLGESPRLQEMARVRLADLLALRGRHGEALELVDGLVGRSEAIRLRRAHALAGLGRFEEAAADYRRFLEVQPEVSLVRFALADAQLNADRPVEALASFEKVASEEPTNDRARLGVAVSLKRAGRLAEALESLERSLDDLPRSGALARELALTLATASDRSLRDGPRAVDLATRLFRDQSSTEHAEILAMALAESGRFDEAIEVQRSLLGGLAHDADPRLRERWAAALRLYEAGEACCGAPPS